MQLQIYGEASVNDSRVFKPEAIPRAKLRKYTARWSFNSSRRKMYEANIVKYTSLIWETWSERNVAARNSGGKQFRFFIRLPYVLITKVEDAACYFPARVRESLLPLPLLSPSLSLPPTPRCEILAIFRSCPRSLCSISRYRKIGLASGAQ